MRSIVRGRGIVLALAVLLVTTLTPAAAIAATSQGSASGSRSVEVVGNPAGTPPTEKLVPFGSGSSVRIVYEGIGTTTKAGDELMQPMIRVGLGWYIYVYMNRTDWRRMTSYGLGATIAIVTALLTRSAVIAAVAAVIGVYVGNYISSHGAPPSGYCTEWKFNYAGAHKGTKNVRRSC